MSGEVGTMSQRATEVEKICLQAGKIISTRRTNMHGYRKTMQNRAYRVWKSEYGSNGFHGQCSKGRRKLEGKEITNVVKYTLAFGDGVANRREVVVGKDLLILFMKEERGRNKKF